MPLFQLPLSQSPTRFSLLALTVALSVAAIGFAPLAARAEVIGTGDVSPSGPTDLPINGGMATGDVVVGDTGVGILTIDIPAFTDPLVSTNGTIGNTATGRGQVLIDGVDSEWSVESVLTIGNLGYAEMSVTAGATLDTDYNNSTSGNFDPDLTIGEESGSQGFLSADGFGTLIHNTRLVVGKEGYGRLDLTGQAWMITRDDASLGSEKPSNKPYGGQGEISVSGAGTQWTVTTNVLVGDKGNGLIEVSDHGLVHILDDAQFGKAAGSYGNLTVSDPGSLFWVEDNFNFGVADDTHAVMLVKDLGVVRADSGLTLGANSQVNLAGGILRSGSAVANSGVLRGEGRIEAAIVNNHGGDIRNAAKTANLRERMLVTGTVDNSGIIESLGGEMEFESAVTNNSDGQIFGKDAVLRFRGGLSNNGAMYVENTIVENTVVNPGLLTVGENSSFILGDLALQSSSTLEMMLGDNNSKLVLDTGDASLGGTLSLSLAPDYTPMVGDSFEILSANSVTGTFSSEDLPSLSGITFDVNYTPEAVFVNVVGGVEFSADFDADGDVDGADLTLWQGGYGTAPGAVLGDGDANGNGSADGWDFLEWQREYSGGAPAVATSNAVPEPSALLLCLTGLVAAGAARRRR